MFKPKSKYKLHLLILNFALCIIVAVYNFYGFYEKQVGMKMIVGIAFGVMALVYAHDLYEFLKNKKRINS
jgi:hypothetical protein